MLKIKPRSTICWLCGRQLYQRRIHVEMIVDGHLRILHKDCAEQVETGEEEE